MSGCVLDFDAEFDLGIHCGRPRRCRRSMDRKLFEAFEALGPTPAMGHRREDLTPYPVLFWPVGAYLIIYRGERRPVEIVAITQGSRDIPSFLRLRLRQ